MHGIRNTPWIFRHADKQRNMIRTYPTKHAVLSWSGESRLWLSYFWEVLKLVGDVRDSFADSSSWSGASWICGIKSSTMHSPVWRATRGKTCTADSNILYNCEKKPTTTFGNECARNSEHPHSILRHAGDKRNTSPIKFRTCCPKMIRCVHNLLRLFLGWPILDRVSPAFFADS